MAVSTYLKTSAAVGVTAVLGGVGTDVRSRWYRRLDEPSWDPPGAAYGPIWTVVFGLTAVGSARALDRASEAERGAYWRALLANLGLNTGWTYVFFRGKKPGWATLEAAALEVSTADLVRRTWALDRLGGAMLVPYALWGGFATALSGAIDRRNDAG